MSQRHLANEVDGKVLLCEFGFEDLTSFAPLCISGPLLRVTLAPEARLRHTLNTQTTDAEQTPG